LTILVCDGVHLGVEQSGKGQALILIHGSWSDKRTWDPVYAAFAPWFRVIRYDRRGYGESQGPGADPATHVNDLLALLRTLELEQVMLVGNSLGGLVAIHAGLRAPDRVSLVVAHEPPLFGLLEFESEHNPVVARACSALARSIQAARAGNNDLSAQIYVEGMASYPGAWQYLPEDVKQGFIENAAAFLADASALQDAEPSPQEIERLGDGVIITRGYRTSPYIKLIVDRLYAALPRVRGHVFHSGGHVPHQSCPEDFVAKTLEFAATARRSA
jgi:pimeloyl-ACP methyl ester carboxylesterase